VSRRDGRDRAAPSESASSSRRRGRRGGRLPRSDLRAWRLPIVVVVPALIITGVVLQQRSVVSTTADTEVIDPTQVMPVVNKPGVASSTFFCAGGTATGNKDGFAEHTVTVANLSGDRRTGKLTVYFDRSDPVTRVIEVGPRSRVDTNLADIGKAEYASAVVEMAGGEIAVEHSVSGPTGRAVATCASSPSNRWYFPAGSTRPGARLVLAVFNPFPDAAVMDITFETEDGRRIPQVLNPLVVPGGHVTGVDITDKVTLRRHVATSVVTRAGSGRVVIDQLQSFDGKDQTTPEPGGSAGGKGTGATATTRPAGSTGTTVTVNGASPPLKDNRLKGLSLMLGAPVPVSRWLFPEGPPLTDGTDQQYVVMNPGEDPVVVEVQLRLDDQERTGPIEPYELTIRGGQYAAVSLTQDTRVPPGVGHWATVTSRGGPVVAARVVTAVDAPSSSDGVPAAVTKGYSLTLGSPLVATRWIVAAADFDDSAGAVVTIVNPSPSNTVHITVGVASGGTGAPLSGFDRVELGPGARAVAPASEGEQGSERAMYVESSEPVMVEQRVAFGRTSFSSALAEPVVGTLEFATSGAPSPADSDTDTPGTNPLADPGASGSTVPPDTSVPGTGTTIEPTGSTEVPTSVEPPPSIEGGT